MATSNAALLLICILSTAHSIGVSGSKDLRDYRISDRYDDRTRFPLITKIREAVSPIFEKQHRSSPPPPEVEETVVEPKASGVYIEPETGERFMEPETGEMFMEPETGEMFIEPKASGVFIEPETGGVFVNEDDDMDVCDDIPPDDIYSCEEQRDFGKCDAEFMVVGNYCAMTCGRQPCPAVVDAYSVCLDIPPDDLYSCGEQRAFGKCDADFMLMGNYCAMTCGRAPCPPIDETCTTISAGVEASPALAFLDLALEVTGYKDLLDDPTLSVTVLAPNNVAFEDFLGDLELTAEQLLEYPAIVENILAAHVLVVPVLAEELDDGDMLETMSELSDVEISFDGPSVMVYPDYGLPAEVVSTDLDACGSVVHVIDTVLVPDRQILLDLELAEPVIANYEYMCDAQSCPLSHRRCA